MIYCNASAYRNNIVMHACIGAYLVATTAGIMAFLVGNDVTTCRATEAEPEDFDWTSFTIDPTGVGNAEQVRTLLPDMLIVMLSLPTWIRMPAALPPNRSIRSVDGLKPLRAPGLRQSTMAIDEQHDRADPDRIEIPRDRRAEIGRTVCLVRLRRPEVGWTWSF